MRLNPEPLRESRGWNGRKQLFWGWSSAERPFFSEAFEVTTALNEWTCEGSPKVAAPPRPRLRSGGLAVAPPAIVGKSEEPVSRNAQRNPFSPENPLWISAWTFSAPECPDLSLLWPEIPLSSQRKTAKAKVGALLVGMEGGRVGGGFLPWAAAALPPNSCMTCPGPPPPPGAPCTPSLGRHLLHDLRICSTTARSAGIAVVQQSVFVVSQSFE